MVCYTSYVTGLCSHAPVFVAIWRPMRCLTPDMTKSGGWLGVHAVSMFTTASSSLLPSNVAAICRPKIVHDQQVGSLPALLCFVDDMKKVVLQVQEGKCTAESASLAYAEEFDATRWVGWHAWLHHSCSAKLAKAVQDQD